MENYLVEDNFDNHPRYECSFDACWCHDSEALRDYMDELDLSEEMAYAQYEKESFRGCP